MRVFVTGGTGMVGRAVVPVLRGRGHDVLVLTRRTPEHSEPNVVHGDLVRSDGIAEALSRFRPDAALHLAWDGIPDYSLARTLANHDMSRAFLTLAAEAGCQCIVSTGSCWEYAQRHGQIGEDAPLSGAEPFHAAKNSLRFLGEGLARAHRAQFYWLRLFFVYGPGQRRQSLIPHVIESIREGHRPELRAPHNRHDFVFVTDVARAIADVIERRPQGTVYNVGSGYPTPVADVIAAVGRLLGRGVPEAIPPAAPEQNFWADISRLRRDTGWQPAVDLDTGLRELLGRPSAPKISPAPG